jgi:hypothetical protein
MSNLKRILSEIVLLEDLGNITVNNVKFRVKTDVNKNPTKKGIKIQFTPITTSTQDYTDFNKDDYEADLQTTLNSGLSNLGLVVDSDPDVPYVNVIGFTLRIESINKLIKNALKGGLGLDDEKTNNTPRKSNPSKTSPEEEG